MKELLKQIAPNTIVDIYRRFMLNRLRKANRTRSAKEVFTSVYENCEWGGERGHPCSGSGSSEYHALRYADAIRAFVLDKGITSVIDLGCGDFAVGGRLQMEGVRYIGIDIVSDLVRSNQEKYGKIGTSFQCLDIISDELPDADLCLVRQVLQHLSNAEIVSVLQKIKKYKYVIITEHYPAPSVKYIPNIDKPHGPDIRVYDNSAVYLDQPPFDIKNLSMIFEDDAESCLVNKGEKIKSFLIVEP